MDCIYFTHHLPLTETVTRKHLALICSLNPDSEVIPLCFEPGRGGQDWQWRNFDLLCFEHFDKHNPKHDYFTILEYDTFCTQSLKDFYGPAYSRPAVSSMVLHPWSGAIIPGSHGEPIRERDWHWWQHAESADIYPYLRGMVPVCGSRFRGDVFFNMVQLWKVTRSIDPLLSEARLGTLACMAGHEPERIRPDCHKFLHSGDVDITQGRGIFHRVRI